VLPIPAFHVLDVNTRDDWNLLNPAGGIHAWSWNPMRLSTAGGTTRRRCSASRTCS
jgi:hypothetical protein